jgi:hypothetical protein
MGRVEIYGLALFGVAAGVVVAALGFRHPNDAAYWTWVLWAGVVVAIGSLAGALAMFLRAREVASGLLSFAKVWRLQWPLTREQKAFSVQRFNHSRCMVDFSPLAEHNYFTLTIFFFNSTSELVIVDSVRGHVSFEATRPDAPLPLGWMAENDPARVEAFGTGAITLRQPVPPTAGARLQTEFDTKHRVSIGLTNVQVRIRSTRNETIALKLWDGVNCTQTKEVAPLFCTGR